MAPYLRLAVSNYPRRQKYRRLSHAAEAALGSAFAAVFGLVAANAGAAPLAGFLVLAAAGLGLAALRWLSLARRSRIGAQSEDEVQRALAALEAEGWRLRHSLAWQGRGDIDSMAIAPTGVAVAIDEDAELRRVATSLGSASRRRGWQARRRRRWARRGALGVMCLVRARGVERVEHDVLVVSVDRSTHVLRVAAGMDPPRPFSGLREVRDGSSAGLPW